MNSVFIMLGNLCLEFRKYVWFGYKNGQWLKPQDFYIIQKLCVESDTQEQAMVEDQHFKD